MQCYADMSITWARVQNLYHVYYCMYISYGHSYRIVFIKQYNYEHCNLVQDQMNVIMFVFIWPKFIYCFLRSRFNATFGMAVLYHVHLAGEGNFLK